jgi:hypothetical protein
MIIMVFLITPTDILSYSDAIHPFFSVFPLNRQYSSIQYSSYSSSDTKCQRDPDVFVFKAFGVCQDSNKIYSAKGVYCSGVACITNYCHNDGIQELRSCSPNLFVHFSSPLNLSP